MPAACEVLWLDPVEKLDNAVRARLGEAGLSVVVVNTLDELNAMLRHVHMVVVRLFEDDDLLARVRGLIADNMLDLPVVCRTDRGALELAVAAMRNGATHVLAADDWNVGSWTHVQSLMAPVKAQPQTFVFADPVSQKLLVLAQRVAQAEVTTLLTGPTGAGKEVLARILHESSPRRTGPFVGLNCAALPESMIEDMLFGHEKGAFTGALKIIQGYSSKRPAARCFLTRLVKCPSVCRPNCCACCRSGS